MTDILKISDEEIVSWLESVGGFPINIDMLKSPSPTFVQNVFSALMSHMHLNVDDMKLPSWNAMQFLQWPEHYENIPVIIFFSYARQIADIARVTDFSIMDLIEPKPKRTKRILCHLISLWKHMLTKYHNYQEVKSSLETKCKDKEALQQKFLEGKEKLKEMPFIDPEECEEAKEVKASVEKQFSDMTMEKDEMSRKCQAMKTAIVDMQSKLSDLEIKILSKKEQLEELSSGILQSPNRLASEVEELQRKLEQESDKVLNLVKDKKEKEQMLKTLKVQAEAMDNITQLQKETCSAAESLRISSASLEEKQSKWKAKLEEEKKKRVTLECTMSSINMVEQRISQQMLKNKSEVDDLQKLHHMLDESVGKNLETLTNTEEIVKLLQHEKETLSKELNEENSKIKELVSGSVVSISQGLKSFDNFILQNKEDINAAKEFLEKFIADCDADLL